jgi:hypothetical protein
VEENERDKFSKDLVVKKQMYAKQVKEMNIPKLEDGHSSPPT